MASPPSAAFWRSSSTPSSSLLQFRNPNPLRRAPQRPARRRSRHGFVSMSTDAPQKPTKLVTFLGKGGSGKTTAAVIAAKYYAKEGLRTCLVLHSQDLTAEYLMGCRIGATPSACHQNLSAVRLETTKMLLEPLARIKKADARVNLSQGILEGVVGEELGILLGMDSVFSALELEKYINFLGRKGNSLGQEFDVIVYDGISTEEMLRLVGSAERARWYLKYIRIMAEKTEIGRLTAPSILKLASESIKFSGGSNEGKTSVEIWDDIEHILKRASVSFTDSSRFKCYLVMDPDRSTSVSSALRYWGCAIQAGIEISGAFAFAVDSSSSLAKVAEKISPLAFALVPCLPTDTSIDWDVALNALSKEAKALLSSSSSSYQSLVQFDRNKKTVTLFMPGFDKSEIKLYQYRGGAELLVEAGDQRRIIHLPTGMQGKVAGAKFADSSLIVTLK